MARHTQRMRADGMLHLDNHPQLPYYPDLTFTVCTCQTCRRSPHLPHLNDVIFGKQSTLNKTLEQKRGG